MSNFSESHSLPTFKQRKAAKKGIVKYAKWLRADRIVDEVYVDICNGASKSEVIQKIVEGLYENQEGKPIKERTAIDYLNAAYQRMMYDFESKAEEMRADLYGKLLTVYADAVKKNDRYNAIQAVNTIMKLTGVGLDKQQTNIQLNANKEGVTINFGFNKNEEETNEEVSGNR